MKLGRHVWAVAGLAAAMSMSVGARPLSFAPVEMHIAHINDHHSQLEGFADVELKLGGELTQVTLGGFARQTALFQQAEQTQKNLIKLHAGDAVTGTLYYTFYKGEADAKLMNTICFDAFELGNHEFDDGDGVLSQFLTALRHGPCQTPVPVLAANVQPKLGTPLAPVRRDDFLQPYVIKKIQGVRVALIGVLVGAKTKNSSRPLDSTTFQDETATAQALINRLKKRQGIRHFVLLTHQGYENDKALAARLSDVDVIIGGDSHTLLGDFGAQGLPSSGPYPTVVKNRDGDPVCIGQAWEYAKAFGLMTVQFNQRGAVASCGGQASLVIGDAFKRKNAQGVWTTLAEAERQTLVQQLTSVPAVKVVQPEPQAVRLLSAYTERINLEKARKIGVATEALCLVRVPGESTNRSGGVAGCEQANTLARGSDAAQAVAQAFWDGSKRADFAIQNAGGVRVPIPAGELTMSSAFTVLPFNNVIVELDLRGQEVLDALEDGVANYLDAALSDGSHPYAAGLRWDLNLSRPKGQRFSQVQVKDRRTGAWSALDPAKRYVLATNDFIATGKDGFATLGKVYAEGRFVNTYLLYTQTFVDWMVARGVVSRPPHGDDAHQHVITKDGLTLP
ncbi:5'-nucleotidase C-terminal domain-containing protein [Leptothrix ochracea]